MTDNVKPVPKDPIREGLKRLRNVSVQYGRSLERGQTGDGPDGWAELVAVQRLMASRSVLSLNGETVESKPGTLLAIKSENQNPVWIQQLEVMTQDRDVMCLVLSSNATLEAMEREQAMSVLFTIVGQGESGWGTMHSEALETMIKVHDSEAESMRAELERRAE